MVDTLLIEFKIRIGREIMRKLLFLFLLIPFQVMAEAPECPIFPNKQECLKSVAENYNNLLDFIDGEYPQELEPDLIQAANDIKTYESLACQKTCFN